jgi:hypothetical protein
MAHPPEKRLELRSHYIGGLPLEHAANKAGVPYATARNWYRAAQKEGDDWDRLRRSTLIVAGGEVEQAMGRLIATGLTTCETLSERAVEIQDPAEAIKAAASLADTIAKLHAARSRGTMPEADRRAVENATVKALTDLFMKLHPALAEKMLSTVEAWANGQR